MLGHFGFRKLSIDIGSYETETVIKQAIAKCATGNRGGATSAKDVLQSGICVSVCTSVCLPFSNFT